MKASVQYDDYKGTTAADRCDLFEELPGQMTQTIFDRFNIQLDGNDYLFVGISVYSTKVDDVNATFYFRNRNTQNVVKVIRHSIHLQTILDMFKRFEFQVGYHLEDIDENQVEEVAKEDE